MVTRNKGKRKLAVRLSIVFIELRRLKIKFKPKLNLSAGSGRSVQLAESGIPDGKRRSVRRGEKEQGRVREIKGLRTELQVHVPSVQSSHVGGEGRVRKIKKSRRYEAAPTGLRSQLGLS